MIIRLFIKPVNKFSELKVGFSPSWKISRKICVICLIESLLKMMNKCFLFHLKSSFHSQDIYVFVTTFWSCRKSSLSGEITLASRFMASQPGLQAGEMRILPNVSRGRGGQAMEFGQLREYSKWDTFLILPNFLSF